MRATGRYRELAIRTTLGAGRGRLIRQMLTEGLVLAIFGGIGGLVLGARASRARRDRLAAGARMTTATLQPAVLAFTMALAIVTGLVFGLVPALVVLRGNTCSLLKDDSTRGSAGRSTGLTRAALVVVRPRSRDAARRRGAAHQELRAAAERRSRVRDRPRADRADLAAGGALSRRRARRAFWSRLIEARARCPA